MQKGDKYGRLTAVRFDHEVVGKPHIRTGRFTKKDGTVSEYNFVAVAKKPYWLFECECGNKKVISVASVTGKKTRSCGCLQKESAVANTIFVKGENHPSFIDGNCNIKTNKFYRTYRAIIQRCTNRNSTGYGRYGGRGIKVLWSSYEDFKRDMYASYISHMEKHGGRNTTIDRIDVNWHYCKENCRWATQKEQARNTTKNTVVEVNGKKVKLVNYADSLGIKSTNLRQKIECGWDEESIRDGKHYYRTGTMRRQEKNYKTEKQQLMAVFNDSVHTAKAYLSVLDDRERDIIEKRFGFKDGKRSTLEEVALTQGVTRERIRQIEARAIEKMEEFAANIRRK